MTSEKSEGKSLPSRGLRIFPIGKPKSYQDAAAEKLEKVSNVDGGKSASCEVEDKKNVEKAKKVETNWNFEPAPEQDPRFQQQNQTMRCYVMYTDFYRCENILGVGNDACKWFQKVFRSVCPNDWIRHWDELRDKNLMPWPKSYHDQLAASQKKTKD